MPITRLTVLEGPALALFKGVTFYTQNDINITEQIETFDIQTSRFGKVDERVKEITQKISFIDAGEVTNAKLAVTHPYGIVDNGTSIFGADSPLTIWTKSGRKFVYAAAAVTKMPSLMLSATKTVFGAIEFTAIRADNTPYSGANSLVTITDAAYPGDAGFNSANIITSPFAGSWSGTVPSGTISATNDANPDVITTAAAHGLVVGNKVTISGVAGDTAINGTFYVLTVPSTTTLTISATAGGSPIAGAGTYTSGGTFTRANAFDSFETDAGYMVDFNLKLSPQGTDSTGLYDMLFSELAVSVKGKPLGILESDVINALQIQGTGASRGRSLSSSGNNLNLTGTGLNFRLYGAALKAGSLVFSNTNKRIGDLEWHATRTFNGGVANPLFAISTATIS